MRLEVDHRHPGLPRALVHQGRRGPAAGGRRMARHAGLAVALEGRHQLRRDRRPLLRLSDLLTTWSRTRRRRRRCAAAIDRITNHILDNRYQLVDVDGKPTRWGWWGPDEIWDDPDETGLRALHIAVAPSRRDSPGGRRRRTARSIQAAYDDLIKTHRYHLLTRNQKIMVPGLDQPFGRRAGVPVVLPAAAVRAAIRRCARSTDRAWSEAGRSSGRSGIRCGTSSTPPAAGGGRSIDRAESLRTLREIPMDLIEWNVKNSHRPDVPIDPMPDRFKRRPGAGRAAVRRAADDEVERQSVQLDGGAGGKREDDGAYFLLPYWMGRFHQLIQD